ncbi:MAG: hypothetical protein MUF10_16330 [Thermoanaerobaculaceae bacterium]|nr:hypothetical protein [Thermoanaerobaculaceae bacterium]
MPLVPVAHLVSGPHFDPLDPERQVCYDCLKGGKPPFDFDVREAEDRTGVLRLTVNLLSELSRNPIKAIIQCGHTLCHQANLVAELSRDDAEVALEIAEVLGCHLLGSV